MTGLSVLGLKGKVVVVEVVVDVELLVDVVVVVEVEVVVSITFRGDQLICVSNQLVRRESLGEQWWL